ncbi:MAG: histidine ammonia-lyase [Phycisphaerales bacterium]|nr:histidine ammonia-lyase [Phycisphaerales bacterium]
MSNAHATSLVLDTQPLAIAELVAVAREGRSVELGATARAAVVRARGVIEQKVASGGAIYGLNTGFGSLSHVRIEKAQIKTLQANIVRSHAAGVGELLPQETARAMLLCLAASLARGASGVRIETLERILLLLNLGLDPCIPSRGSVGASGDLAPLAHAALCLLGEGEVFCEGKRVPTATAYAKHGLQPIALEEKEGLALLNGTHLMAGMGALLIADLHRLLDAAIVAGALAFDAAKASDSFLHPALHALRRQPGQIAVAQRLRELTQGSAILASHKTPLDARVQDPYCLRCMPQVLGAVRDAIDYATHAIERELGAVTDNPLVIGDELYSGGNFHGMPLAIPLDVLAIAVSHIAGISERRTFWVLSASDRYVAHTPYLAPEPGLQSGLMIAQYTAAACVNEIITLCNPSSVANVVTSAGIEDYNSFGPAAAHKLKQCIARATSVVAIEVLTMCEGIDAHRPLRSSDALESVHASVRKLVPRLTGDRSPSPDIAAIESMIMRGACMPT